MNRITKVETDTNHFKVDSSRLWHMADFIKSPLFDNWFADQVPSKHLVVCAPYIKEDAIRTIFDQFKLTPSTAVIIDIFTTGRPDVFVSGSSDVSAFEFLSAFKTVSIYLVDNIHMKAYCIDDEVLLVGSGNCTSPGLFPQGNVEAAISSTESDVIIQFNAYCKAIAAVSQVLSNHEDIVAYCDDLSQFYGMVHEETQLESQARSTIRRLGRTKFISRKFVVKGIHRIRKKVNPLPWTSQSPASERRQVAIVNADLPLTDLTPEMAYFLGGIVAGDARVWVHNGNQYNDFTVKQNNSPKDAEFIERLSDHAKYVSETALSIEPEIVFHPAQELGLQGIFGVHVGFSLLFRTEFTDPIERKKTILDAIRDSDDEIVHAFLVGIFDTRGYVDKNFGFIGLDVSDEDVAAAVIALIQRCGVDAYNYNPSRERENNKGTPRKPQLRIKIRDYFDKIGIISPDKVSSAKENEDFSKEEFINDSLLPGLKMI